MCVDVYQELLKKFGDTLKEASYDSANKEYMTESEKEIVNLDAYAKSISQSDTPSSCDTLFLYETDKKWYLIEFKNGVLEHKHEIKEKILESLLLLTKELNKTVDFFQKSMTFMLVYNKSKNSRENISNQLSKLNFLPKRWEGVYLKEIRYCEKGNFQADFVDKYCD